MSEWRHAENQLLENMTLKRSTVVGGGGSQMCRHLTTTRIQPDLNGGVSSKLCISTPYSVWKQNDRLTRRFNSINELPRPGGPIQSRSRLYKMRNRCSASSLPTFIEKHNSHAMTNTKSSLAHVALCRTTQDFEAAAKEASRKSHGFMSPTVQTRSLRSRPTWMTGPVSISGRGSCVASAR